MFVFLSLFYLSHARDLDDYPFRNVSLSFEKRVENLVGLLSLDELVDQMAHGGASRNGPAPAIPRLKINPYQWGTECLSGDVDAGDATSFPISLGMAATFNYDIVYAVARATSDEVRAKNTESTSKGNYDFHTGLSCWSPVINIMRHPLWGRNQETYGEDPWLSGYLGQAFVTGLQGNDSRYVEANAGCKHFDVHGGPENIPVSRFSFDANVNERDWRMTFLPQFKACVDAGSWSLMCSYNSINGIPACANKQLLTDILRNEWNFKGYVVSDQGALENIYTQHHYTDGLLNASIAAASAGTCLEDGNADDKGGNVFANLGDAVGKSMLSIDVLKDAVSRLFMVRMKLGEFDPPAMNPYTKISTNCIQSDKHKNISIQAALESIVLIKNNRANGLPNGATHSTCVVGPFIDDPTLLFGDYSPTIMTDHVTTPLAGFKKYLYVDKINSAVGCEDGPKCTKYNSDSITQACLGVESIIVTAGLSRQIESEGNDRADLNLPGSQLQLIKDAAATAPGAPVFLVLFNAGPVDISWAVEYDQVGSILVAFYPAQATGEALGMIFTGKYTPAGRLPFTWPKSLNQFPPITNYTMVNRTYRYFKSEPLFPFGYGLSWTHFKYSDLKIEPATIKAGKNVTVSVTVTNIGERDADEVTQVYIKWDDSVSAAPIRQLVGTKRSFIKQTTDNVKKLQFTITAEQMQVWTTKWEIPSGEMSVYVGGQQPDQTKEVPSNILKGSFKIES